ncbi:hypothetical protein [uncultured Actinomyces sp.]|uniref:hypothetical protein n=1 Tax=uncultured Actinomyces sp. TaxID=249061 RepID=UPI00288B4D40|nr:hypothetical protein [uncultured Actinomyces sp.]
MKETTPANKKTRKAFKHNASTHHGHEQAASGANTSTDPLGAYKLPELPKVELPALPKVELPELPQPPDAAQLEQALADLEANTVEAIRVWEENNRPEIMRARMEQALADLEANTVEAIRVWEENNRPENVRARAEEALANMRAHLEEVAQQVRANPELSPLPALPDLKPVNVEAVMRDVDAASVQAVNVLEEVAERDTALFESLDTQGGDVIG